MTNLTHIIETLNAIDKDNENNEDIFEVLSVIVNLLNNCNPKRLTKAYYQRTFKIRRLLLTIDYKGERN